ncbi:MAG: dephospho-CoA kinase [Bacteroidia bacterium]
MGVTGGIGSGKSTVCQIFEHLNVPIYYADVRAKALMQEDPNLKKQIRKAFGWDAYDEKDQLNRSYLAKIVFNNSEKLTILNTLVHPSVFADYRQWVARQSEHPYSIKEAALMFETDSYKELDKIIVVTAPINLRLERVVQRDNVKNDDVLKRMENQMNDRERIAKADFILKNDGKLSLVHQVLQLHHQFLEFTKK